MTDNLIKCALFILGVIVFGQIMILGMKKQEVVDCNSWKKQASEYPAYYLTKSQDDQCRAHGIVISTTVIGK